MPRTRAGYRYPHASTDAREHDHRMCAVIDAIAQRAGSGAEEWGTAHHMPPLGSATEAHRARNKLFNGRDCAKLAKAHGALSVSVMYLTPSGEYTNTRTTAGDGYVLVVRVWPRATGQQEIVSRVGRGERLTYNAFREN